MKTIYDRFNEQFINDNYMYSTGNLNSMDPLAKKLKEFIKKEQKRLMKDIDKYFNNLRFDKSHHLGLGDIRITIAQQEEIINKIKKF